MFTNDKFYFFLIKEYKTFYYSDLKIKHALFFSLQKTAAP